MTDPATIHDPDATPKTRARKPVTTVELPTPEAELWARLTAPFPESHIERLPKPLSRNEERKGRCDGTDPWVTADGHKCGGWHSRAVHLDYIGHGGITTRLNDVLGPAGWDFQPYALTPDGIPGMTNVFWAKLTIMGVTKWDCAADFKGPQEAYGDALRRCAMRFGIGTYLWSKSEYATAIGQDPGGHTVNAIHRAVEADRPPVAPEAVIDDDLVEMGTSDLLLLIDDYAQKEGKTFAAFTERFRMEAGGKTVDEMDECPAPVLVGYVMRLRAHYALTGDRDE